MSVLGQALDWQQPWLAPWRAEAATVDAMLAAGASVAEVLNTLHRQSASGAATLGWMPVFVPQAALPADQAYEKFIFDTRQIPSRDNLHDMFNGLCWLRFPQSKRRLNQLQAQAIARDGVQAQRGPLRDALTLFDENAAVLMATPALWQALQTKDWQALFVTHRADWAQAQLVLF